MTQSFLSFQCDTCSTFPTHSCRTTTAINVEVVIQKIGKDPEENLVGCFDELKINCGILHCFKGKTYRQYHDTHDMEWPYKLLLQLVFCFDQPLGF